MSGDAPAPEEILIPDATPAALDLSRLNATALYLDGADNLRIATQCSIAGVTVAVQGRIRTPEGLILPFALRGATSSDRTIVTTDFSLTKGYLENLIAFVTEGAPKHGQCSVRLHILRGLGTGGNTTLGTLVQGYITQREELAWPPANLHSVVEGPGVIRTITGTDPAAGAEISETVPTAARWELLTLATTLATDATAINRFPRIVFDDGATAYLQIRHVDGLSASQSLTFWWTSVGWLDNAGLGAAEVQGLPTGLVLTEGHRIRTSTIDFQAGDNWDAPIYIVREHMEAS